LAAKQQPARYLVHDPDDLPNNVTTVAAGRIYAEARDVARALAKTEAFKQSSRDRKRVEMLFAHLKRILRLGRLRLRGPCGAQFEFTWAAIAKNLRRLAKLVARPPPIAPVCAAKALQASVKSSVSRPHNPAGDNEWFQKMHQPPRAVGMPVSATKSAPTGPTAPV
jgi:hypothetical protein